jgi:DNA replicative helicase MCM subunit Mcm2 (Cdc46/Mcm family)
MELIHNRSWFTDKQHIRLQETPDEIPEGETPTSVTLFAFDDLVDTVRPGDRIEITGVFRAVSRRVNPRVRTVHSVFKTYIDSIHFRKLGAEDEEHGTHAHTYCAGYARTSCTHAITLLCSHAHALYLHIYLTPDKYADHQSLLL